MREWIPQRAEPGAGNVHWCNGISIRVVRMDDCCSRSETMIAVSGHLDAVTAPTLRDTLEAIPLEVRRLTLDLTGVGFIGAAGITELVSLVRVRPADVILTLRPSAEVYRLLTCCGLAALCGPAKIGELRRRLRGDGSTEPHIPPAQGSAAVCGLDDGSTGAAPEPGHGSGGQP